MTAMQIMDEIETLEPGEQAEVIRFVTELGEQRRLSGAELTGLAARLAETKDAGTEAALRSELELGFYREDGRA